MPDQLDNRQYVREYRSSLGFTSQQRTKEFLSAKDVIPGIDFQYIDRLLERLCAILNTVNASMHPSLKHRDIDVFCTSHISEVYATIRNSEILPRLNNQGRRPEQVLYSWLRGYAMTRFLRPALANLFDLDQTEIQDFGDDDFRSPDTFRRTPKADLKLNYKGNDIVIEVQSGFQGINDIKQHKVLEAKRISREESAATICTHFDVFSGQVAFVRLDTIAESSMNWITRQQMEGQTVFNIDQEYFSWRIMNPLPTLAELELGL